MSEYLERLKKALADRYTVQEEIGRGGMATVYLALDVRHHRKVAVKVLRPELAAARWEAPIWRERTTTRLKRSWNRSSKKNPMIPDTTVHSGWSTLASAERKTRSAKDLRAVELLPVSMEAMRGFYRVEDLAHIYAAVGEYDEAVDRLTYLMSIPGDLAKAYIDIDPAWDPLRNHPAFRRFMAGLN